MYNSIKEAGRLINILETIKDTESAYKEAQKFLAMDPSSYNMANMFNFVKNYERNR